MDARRQLSERWSREILFRCSPKELLVLTAVYGVAQVARRMGFENIAEFVSKKLEDQQ